MKRILLAILLILVLCVPAMSATTIKQRGDTAAAWTAANPVLGEREVGWETDTRQSKLGDGVTAWSSLPYVAGTEAAGGLASHVADTDNPHSVTPAQIGAATAAQGALADTALQPGDVAGTDDQTIDAFTLGGTTLSLSLESDGEAAQTVDLSSLQDGTGTDDQTAAEVPFTPEGTIAATTVQAAIQEVRDEAGAGSGDLVSTNNLSDLTSASTARTNLGLGTVSTVDSGTTIGTAVLWVDDGSGNASIPIGTFSPDTIAGYQVNGSALVDDTATNGNTSAVWSADKTYDAIAASGGTPAIADITDWPAAVSAAEVGYLDGVTSGIQAQIDGVSVAAPTIQAADPTADSAEGWYLATTSGDAFYKSSLGLFTIAGSYAVDPDYTPTGFGSVFLADTDVALSTLSTAGETYTVAGVTAGTAISVTGGEYQIDAASWISTSGTVSNDDVIGVRQTSSASNSTQTDAVVTIGTVSDTYSVTTVAAGSTPSFYMSMDTLSVSDPDTGSTLVANAGATSTAGHTSTAYEYSSGTDGYVKIALADIDISVGTLDFWLRPDYTGYPSSIQDLIYGGVDLTLIHNTDGALTFSYKYAYSTIADWSPVSGTWYHLVAKWDNAAGAYSLAVDAATSTSPQSTQAEPVPTVFSVGREYRTTADFAVDEFYIYKEVTP